MAFDTQEKRMRNELQEHEEITNFFGGDVYKSEHCSGVVAKIVKAFGRLNALLHWGAIHFRNAGTNQIQGC